VSTTSVTEFGIMEALSPVRFTGITRGLNGVHKQHVPGTLIELDRPAVMAL
jgi:hypothetical protein